jgi:hypothetical protein
MSRPVRHGYADGRFGQVHYTKRGSGEPLLYPHRANEYADVVAQFLRRSEVRT